MAKEEKKDLSKPVEVRAQTEDEVRRRLKSQGKLPATPKKEDDGIHELTEDEALVNIEDRKERLEKEANEENELVRPLTNKDIALNKAARKEREDVKKEDPTSRVQTEEDIKERNNPDPDPDEKLEPGKEEKPNPEPEPVEIYAKDIVTFKDEDEKMVTGKVKRVTSKNEAIIDVKEGDDEYSYTVPCSDLTKVDKEEK